MARVRSSSFQIVVRNRPIFGRNGWSMTGAYVISNAGEQLVDEPYRSMNANKDLIIPQMFGFFTDQVNRFTGYYEGLKAINPDLKILPYTSPGAISKTGAGVGNPDWVKSFVDTDGHSSWLLRDSSGNTIESSWSAANLRMSWTVQFNTNNPAGRHYGGEFAYRLRQAIEQVNANGRMGDQIDGVYFDVVPPTFQVAYVVDSDPRVASDQDFNQDGSAEDRGDETDGLGSEDDYGGARMYRRGVIAFADAVTAELGSDFVLWRNSTRDGLDYSGTTNVLGDGDAKTESEFYRYWGGGIFEDCQRSLCCQRDGDTNTYPYQGWNGLEQQCRHVARIKSSNMPAAVHPWGKFGEHAVCVELAMLDRDPTQADYEMARYCWAFCRLNGVMNGLSRGKERPFPLLDEDVPYTGDTVDGLPPAMGTYDPATPPGGASNDFSLRSPDYSGANGSAFYWQLFVHPDGTRYCVIARTDAGGISAHGQGDAEDVQLPYYGDGNTAWYHLDGTDGEYANEHTGLGFSNQSPAINDGSQVPAGGSYGTIALRPFHARLLVGR
ncbi:MAG: hypothetical protein JRI23_25320 [Deltaproteobacteria bacterium]|jgi:hypothetical protein|nr:hypothetical protein [Deltaproteobacteria bacterium]MBW2535339.1 hypothetical protein [Deltaproteobacteria bacterium]